MHQSTIMSVETFDAGIHIFSTSQGGPSRTVLNTTPSKKRGFNQSSTEFCKLVTGFGSSGSRFVSGVCGVDSDLESPAKKRLQGKTKTDKCSVSGAVKVMG